jgi:hypothetical protein
MRLREWDAEFRQITAEVRSMSGITADRRQSMRNARELRQTLVQQQVGIGQLFTKIQKMTGLNLILQPREKSLLHWAGILGEASRHLYDLKNQYLTRLLWLHLVRSRLTGEASERIEPIKPDDLIRLTVREAELEKTESLLKSALTKFRDDKRRLFDRYNQLNLKQANLTAARTMAGRLGGSLTTGLRSPTMNALSQWLRKVTAPVQSKRVLHKLSALQSDYSHKSQEILSGYQRVVLRTLQEPKPKLSEFELADFGQKLRDLSRLDAETRVTYQKLFRDAAGSAPSADCETPSPELM